MAQNAIAQEAPNAYPATSSDPRPLPAKSEQTNTLIPHRGSPRSCVNILNFLMRRSATSTSSVNLQNLPQESLSSEIPGSLIGVNSSTNISVFAKIRSLVV